VVVAAWNEATRIAQVISTIRGSQVVGRVIVVDDGSTDATADRARAAGAEVIELPRNMGKAAAMFVGYCVTRTDPVAFFDADLKRLTSRHVATLVSASRGVDQVGALRDRGLFGTWFARSIAPFITGERIVRRWVLDAVPVSCWRSGYGIETAINWACDRGGGRTRKIVFPGVNHTDKTEKDATFWGGLRRNVRMFEHLANTTRCLGRTGACCGTPPVMGETEFRGVDE